MTWRLKRPADVDGRRVGHNLGDKFTRHHKVVDVMTHLAEARPIAAQNYGATTETPCWAHHVPGENS